jgi:hypothetical protein
LVDDERVYFPDPDGLVIELEVGFEVDSDPEAEKVLERWCEKRNSGL